ncbi:hypothetical protein [Burkholderia orbicola]|uniref:hypothetical protein n=1 Tax=Burkholderia orbicola TaxID=2978683 RepID=UPI002FE36CCF
MRACSDTTAGASPSRAAWNRNFSSTFDCIVILFIPHVDKRKSQYRAARIKGNSPVNAVNAMSLGTKRVVTRGETMTTFDAFDAAFDDVPSVAMQVAEPA